MKISFLKRPAMWLLLPAMALLASCDDSKNEGDGNGNEPAPTEQSFSIDVSNRTMSGATITVTPALEGEGYSYYISVENKAEVDKLYATDEAYIKARLDFIKVMAGVNGLPVETYLRGELKNGRSEHNESSLYYDTEYYVSVFGLEADGTVTTSVTRETFRTETFTPSEECRFVIQEIEGSATANSLKVEIGASDPEVRYYVTAYEATEFDSYETVDEVVADAIFWANLFDEEDFWSDPANTYAGRQTITIGELEAATEYVVLVFGVSAEGEQTTEAATERLSTTAE